MFASLIGAAAMYARVASAVPMAYGTPSSGYSSPSPAANSYGSGYGSGNNANNNYGNNSPPAMSMSMSMSMAAYPASTPAYSSPPPPSYSSPSYGSGSSSWNDGNYNNCVQQCMSEYGSGSPPPSMNMPPSSPPPSNSGNGNGATHTVIVAPTQGVLRYVPFALNASVGDTIQFMWGANNHTVTKSSELEPCNKTSDKPFASGEQNKGFMFTQVVNDTNTTFFYCGTPTHCEKGMFGILNPPSAYMQPGSASNMLPQLASMYPSTNQSLSYTSNATANNSAAASWGMNIDMSQMPGWAAPYVAENMLYTQLFAASNPATLNSATGNIDLSSLNGSMVVPMDVAANARLNNADSSSPTPSGATPSTSPSPSGNPSGALKSGAGALASPRVAVALVAVAAAFFAL